MNSIATFQCYGKPWIAEQVYGESSRHLEIAAGAHYNRTPYCRKHLLSLRQGNKDPIPETLREVLLVKQFDLSPDFDLLVVQHNLTQDPIEEFAQLQLCGRKVLSLTGKEVPDYAYLDNLSLDTARDVSSKNYLSLSDSNDLSIARRALTGMLFERCHD